MARRMATLRQSQRRVRRGKRHHLSPLCDGILFGLYMSRNVDADVVLL
jgi:hypothetical protein